MCLTLACTRLQHALATLRLFFKLLWCCFCCWKAPAVRQRASTAILLPRVGPWLTQWAPQGPSHSGTVQDCTARTSYSLLVLQAGPVILLHQHLTVHLPGSKVGKMKPLHVRRYWDGDLLKVSTTPTRSWPKVYPHLCNSKMLVFGGIPVGIPGTHRLRLGELCHLGKQLQSSPNCYC